MAEHSLAEFQAVLEKHRSNEAAYKDRLKEINLTRGKIADQLEALSQTYDRKLKGLEQKLEALKGQNDALLRENTLYKSEIETYQSRLLEKEKIIAALLSQRRDLPLVASSEKSKSDKTESLNANEDESKAFKKQAGFKEDYEQPASAHQKFRQEPPLERERNNAEPAPPPKVEKPVEKQQTEVKPPPKKKAAAPPSKPANVLPLQITSPEPAPTSVEEPIKQAEQVERHPPPPPPPAKSNKNKARKSPPVPRRFEAEPTRETTEEASDFFSSLGRQEQEVKIVHEQQVTAEHVSHHLETEQLAVPEQAFEGQTHAVEAEQQEIHQHFSTPQFEAEELPVETADYQQEYNQREQPHVQQDDGAYNAQPQEESTNFLSHFNQKQAEAEAQDYYQPVPRKKPNKKKYRPEREEQPAAVQQEATGSDFFAQLSKGEHEAQHQLDNIEESSIDHIDRDNSLLSNEQPYFAEEPAPKRAVKMPKKKKREQIKVMDPSCFD